MSIIPPPDEAGMVYGIFWTSPCLIQRLGIEAAAAATALDWSARMTQVRGLGAGLILRALVDDLAVIHVQLARVHGVAAGDGAHMEVLDPMEVSQRKGKPLALCGRDKLIDVNRMNRFITGLIATTVAQWFPASGEAG
jgi:hypothetical protein